MESKEYKLMFELEENHWWYKGLRNLIFSNIRSIFKNKKGILILDAGCGTGFTLKLMDKYGSAFGIDISKEALKYCLRRNLNKIIEASIMQVPFKNESFDLVISNDVLYHKLVTDDEAAIKEFHRILKKNGNLIINLPAHKSLRRFYDECIHTRHRYIKNEVYSKLKKNNFKIIKISYRCAFLFLFLSLFKFLQNKYYKNRGSDLYSVNIIVNFILYSFLKIENSLLKIMNIPFGSSVFCFAKKMV